ncbi:hypothetical protein [Streptomyces chattanoogensis]|uniref:Uncharacterized protein n=1 Tax=Streptomyces chattanoogensis TaxID=66876 RepID=A0A0N1JVP9_9ACTN|nr:hypothetical protein [Streptomyces chattanoogensis]KPC59206.1 hypothetical protein ADL29_35965 [Streptomyces chattanoogensis]
MIDLRTKRQIGRASFTATQEIQLAHLSGQWHTENTLTLDSAYGAAKGLRAAWKVSCSDNACNSDSAWTGSESVGKGRVADGATTHNWKAGKPVQGFRLKSTVTILGVGQVLIAPAWFQVPTTVRCDKTCNAKSSRDGKSRG